MDFLLNVKFRIDPIIGDAPDLVAGGALADDASAAVVYVEALASGFGTLFGGLEVVRPDVIAPVISLNGGATISQEAMVAYQESGATATDDVDGAVDVTVSGPLTSRFLVITPSPMLQATRRAISPQLSCTVQVVDTTPPAITLNRRCFLSPIHQYGLRGPGCFRFRCPGWWLLSPSAVTKLMPVPWGITC